ncbi:MAG: nucleotidyl transferase AbiEii/AbiGii toxin family protein [Moheibacter sp.]
MVGGTALSLQLGHRTSVDIDLFSDLEYGSIDFKVIDTFLKSE